MRRHGGKTIETLAPSLHVTVPLETEVLREHRQLVTGSRCTEEEGIIADRNIRRLAWPERLVLPTGTKVHWADVHAVDIRELSALPWPILYRLTHGDG
jgi:hypothetical protein